MTRPITAACLLTAVSLLACSEPGTLVITLGGVPTTTAATHVSISGVVSRVPAQETQIIVTSSGGAAPASDTASADGSFTLPVSLVANAVNTIVLTAQDGTGSVSAPVTVEVRQDGVAPSVVSVTPTGDDVSTAPSISVTFSEPVVLDGTDAVQLGNRVHAVPASALLSTDSLTVSLALSEVLLENAVYGLTFPGVEDVAGNAVTPPESACFVTANTVPAATQQTDPTDDIYALGDPVGRSPPDVDLVRLAIHTNRLFGVLRFTTVRSFGSTTQLPTNNTFAYLELDLDEDSATGSVTLKDTLFAGVLGRSGLRAEAVVAIDWFGQFGDSAVVGQYWADTSLVFDVTHAFIPEVCDRYVGFAVPFGTLGTDDGNFGYVLFAGNEEADGLLLDPMPESGHFTAAFAGQFAPGGAPVASTTPWRRVRLRSPRVP